MAGKLTKETIRFETSVSTTTVDFGAVRIAKQAIVSDESERNVAGLAMDSGRSNGKRQPQ